MYAKLSDVRCSIAAMKCPCCSSVIRLCRAFASSKRVVHRLPLNASLSFGSLPSAAACWQRRVHMLICTTGHQVKRVTFFHRRLPFASVRRTAASQCRRVCATDDRVRPLESLVQRESSLQVAASLVEPPLRVDPTAVSRRSLCMVAIRSFSANRRVLVNIVLRHRLRIPTHHVRQMSSSGLKAGALPVHELAMLHLLLDEQLQEKGHAVIRLRSVLY